LTTCARRAASGERRVGRARRVGEYGVSGVERLGEPASASARGRARIALRDARTCARVHASRTALSAHRPSSSARTETVSDPTRDLWRKKFWAGSLLE
jgi:hypothetical protein